MNFFYTKPVILVHCFCVVNVCYGLTTIAFTLLSVSTSLPKSRVATWTCYHGNISDEPSDE